MLISEIEGCGIYKYLRDNVQNSHHNMQKISSNELFTNHFSKSVTFTKFLPKMRERLGHSVEIAEIHSHTFLAKIS